jgi:hypothetical protein
MRNSVIGVCAVLVLACSAFGQQPAAPAVAEKPVAADKPATAKPSTSAAAQSKLNGLLESKIRMMWAAFKNKDKKAYAEFLADDFMAVEEDGQGERTKMVVLREVGESVVHEYHVQLFRVDPIAAGAQFVTYENVIEFPPGTTSRFEKIFISEVWVKRNGEWKSWRYQATRVK